MKLSHSLKIKTTPNAEESDLHCPRCDGQHLHHSRIIAFDRDEDAADVTRVEVVGSKVAMDRIANADTENPSSRRDGVVITFWCENCGDDKLIRLNIAQHKGSTQMSWSFTPH